MIREAPQTYALITSFNYQEYVEEALFSALGQTKAFDGVLVVDDGSTDESLSILRERLRSGRAFQLISKANGGQASAILEGARLVPPDALVFLLDADDVWPENYVSTILSFYNEKVDFYFSKRRLLSEVFLPWQREIVSGNSDCKCQLLQPMRSEEILFWNSWRGASTSGLAVRAGLLVTILENAILSEWKVRADDLVVIGADLLGANKVFIPNSFFLYRIHGKNNFASRRRSFLTEFRREISLMRFFEDITQNRAPWPFYFGAMIIPALLTKGNLGILSYFDKFIKYTCKFYFYRTLSLGGGRWRRQRKKVGNRC